MAANEPGDGAGAAAPAVVTAAEFRLVVFRWPASSAPIAPPPTLPTTSPAASMAAAMLRAGRWGKEGTGWICGGGGGGSGAMGGSMKSGANGSFIGELH